MTENNVPDVNTAEKKEVTVKWSKLIDGVGLVFAGAISMLEALDAGSARDIMKACNLEGSEETEKEDTTDAAQETGTGTVDGVGADDAPVAVPADAVETQPAPKEEKAAPGVTQDDITKIIVQKLKKDRTNNEKIGAILKTYGVTKVSELPADKYEAFLTDLSEL